MPGHEQTATVQLSRQEILDRREEIVADTQEWLGRSAVLMNSIRRDFPYTRMEMKPHGSAGNIQGWHLTSPLIVLPARPLNPHAEAPRFERRSATRLELEYDCPRSEALDLQRVAREGEFPIPDAAFAHLVHPIALPSESGRPSSQRYLWTGRESISGWALDMYPWSSDAFGASLPQRHFIRPGEDELRNFTIFRDYPAEALVRRPDAIDYHHDRIHRFQDALGEIALAVADPSLNPR